VNCFAIALTLAAIRCFRDAQPTRGRAVAVGAILGLGLFTKTTMIAFTLIPVTAALVWQRGQPALAIRRLALIYTIAVLPPVLSYLMVPDAPVFAINHLLLHHNSFFTSPTALLSDPLINVARNGVLVGEYLHHYLTPLFAAAALTCAIFLASRREPAAAFVAAAFVVPVTLQIVVLEYFPSGFCFHTCGRSLLRPRLRSSGCPPSTSVPPSRPLRARVWQRRSASDRFSCCASPISVCTESTR
jgi:hypothetical protein